MKTTKLANKFLSLMVKEFKKSGKDAFSIDFFQNKYPDVKEFILIAALKKLYSDEFVSLKFYDNKPSIIFLDIPGIQEIEENTLLKKGYTVFKEIKELFN